MHPARISDDAVLAEFLADDQLHPTFTSYAVTSRLVVGFVSAGYKPDAPGEHGSTFIVIDRKHQGSGLGRATMVAVINLLSADPRGSRAWD